MSHGLATKCEAFVTSLVIGKDAAARYSVPSLIALRDEMSYLSSRCKLTKFQIFWYSLMGSRRMRLEDLITVDHDDQSAKGEQPHQKERSLSRIFNTPLDSEEVSDSSELDRFILPDGRPKSLRVKDAEEAWSSRPPSFASSASFQSLSLPPTKRVSRRSLSSMNNEREHMGDIDPTTFTRLGKKNFFLSCAEGLVALFEVNSPFIIGIFPTCIGRCMFQVKSFIWLRL
jgi:hypothetical protein